LSHIDNWEKVSEIHRYIWAVCSEKNCNLIMLNLITLALSIDHSNLWQTVPCHPSRNFIFDDNKCKLKKPKANPMKLFKPKAGVKSNA
jgi:hypothetical protein